MNKEIEWVPIKEVENLSLAEMDKDLLEKEGIPVMIKSGGAAAYMGASAPQEILVPKEHVKKAREFLV